MSATTQDKPAPASVRPGEVRIVSHSMLFYWWPVWAVGFLMAALTYLNANCLGIVPQGTEPVEGVNIPEYGTRSALVFPAGKQLPVDRATGKPMLPSLRMASRSGPGVIFVLVLLLVIFITNVPIRGLASVFAILAIILLAVVLALFDAWEPILEMLVHSRIYLNAFGYLAIAVPLFVLWLVFILIVDRQVYMVFTSGQLRLHQNIGGGETVFDTIGMVVTKRRSDLFRHWILGMGSGDLVVKTAGSAGHEFQMPNVLFVGSKLELIQQMIQQREVVAGS
jgi:hypothetical protein